MVTQRQDAVGENRHLPWGLLGAPLLDLQDSEPKVSNVLPALRQVLWAARGRHRPALTGRTADTWQPRPTLQSH